MTVHDGYNANEISWLFDNYPDGCALHEIVVDDGGQPIDYVFLKVNHAFEELTGLKADEIIGRRVTEVLPGIERDPFISIYGHVALTGEPTQFEQYSSPLKRYYDITAFSPRKGLFVTTFTDATERKRAEEKLRSQHSVLEGIIESTDSPIFSVDKSYCYTSFNRAHAAVMKATYGVDIKLGKNTLEYQTVDEDRPVDEERIKAKLNLDRALQGERLIEEAHSGGDTRSRSHFEVSYNPIRDTRGEVTGVTVYARDITKRKLAEDELHRTSRTLRALTDCNQALIRITEEESLLREICNILVEACGYRMAWVGFANYDENKTVRPMAYAGYNEGFLEAVDISWADTDKGRGPTGTAIRTGQLCVSRDIQNDPNVAFLRAEAEKRGYASYVAIPLISDGKTYGALVVYAAELDVFYEQEVNLLIELAGDLSYGIAALRIRAERDQMAESLHESNEQLNLALRGSNTGLWNWDIRTNQVHFSPEWKKQLGYEDHELPQRFEEFEVRLHPDDHDRVIEVAEKYKENPQADFEAIYRLRHKDGSYRWMLTRTSTLLDSHGDHDRLLGLNVDITDIAESLETSEEKLSRVFDASPDAIWVVDLNGNIIECNRAALDMQGFSAMEELIGRSGLDLVAPRDREKALANINETLKQGIIRNTEYSLLSKDGKEFPAEVSAGLIRGPSGIPQAFVVISKDITERKHMEEELYRINRLLRTLSECNQVLVRVTDEMKLMREICRACVEFGGYRLAWVGIPEQDEHKTIRLIAQAGYEDGDFELISSTWVDERDPAAIAIRTGKPSIVNNILDNIPADPVYAPWRDEVVKYGYNSVASLPLTIKGQVFGALNICAIDAFDEEEMKLLDELADDLSYGITSLRAHVEREQAEERYRSLVENLNDIIFTVDLEGRINYISPVVSIFGYTPDELMGEQFRRFIAVEDLPEVMSSFENALKGNIEQYEFRILDRENKVFYVRYSGRPIVENGQVVGITGRLTDITRQRQLEEELRHSQKMEAVGQLAGGVAHDFNNLLQVISGYSEIILSRAEAGSMLHTYVGEILGAGERATSLTRQLLAFSRKQMIQLQVFSVNDTIDSISKMLKRLIGEDIKFATVLSPEIMQVEADPGQVEQVIMNLAVNARDAMPEGGQLTIRTENVAIDESQSQLIPESLPGEYVCISLSDTGFGMSEETIERIFEPFFSTKGIKGTGLGLSVVFGIVKQHNGWINVHSEPGQGSVFRIYLPAISQKREIEHREAIPETELRGNGERVLLVEDEHQVRVFVRQVLQDHGYVVFEASNVKEATEIFEREGNNIHLVFSDVVLTDGTGIQLVETLGNNNPDIHVLLSSGYTEQKSQWQEIQEKRYPFIQKTYKISDMLKAIKEAMRSDLKNRKDSV